MGDSGGEGVEVGVQSRRGKHASLKTMIASPQCPTVTLEESRM